MGVVLDFFYLSSLYFIINVSRDIFFTIPFCKSLSIYQSPCYISLIEFVFSVILKKHRLISKTFALIKYWYKLSKYVINVKYLKNSNTLYPKWIENGLESSALECPNYDYPAFRHDKICETDNVLYRS